MQAAAAPNPLAPFFPPFTHFVIVYRENHTFDDYLGDCASTVQAGCNGVVQGTNHISSVPNLHTLAKTYALLDSYSTGTQPPSGPNHWWLFSAQSSSSSQQQSYPAAAGTQFDRFLKGPSGGEPFIMSGDFYWMLATGSGYWRNPATNAVEVLPVNRPGTSIPEELNYNHYTCCGQNDDDQVIANDYMNFVTTNGLPPYSYVELFNDHPGTYQDIPKNDSVAKQVVDFIMNNAAYKNNTLIVVTEDDTQNGSNGPDHVSNTYRVPTVIVASPTYMKQAYISHIAYKTDNVLAAMERVMENVHTGVIDPNNNIGLATFPMTTADQAGLGDPLEDLWIQGATPLSATAAATPTTGNAPFSVSFTGSASGGKPAYSYSWNFGDGSAASTVQNPTHTYNLACTCTATLTVTDSSAPANTATSSVTITASPVAGTPPGAPTGLSASVGNARISLSWSAPASNGGVNITSYNVYRGTSSGAETLLTTGGCSSLGVVLSCTDTGLTNGQSYFYKVSAPNSLQFNRASPTCDYNPSSGRTRGFATSPAFDISTASGPTLTFNTKYQVESYSGHTDQMKVQAKTASGTWTTLWTRDSTNPAQTSFTSVSLDLSAYKSSGSQVRFSFDSMDTYSRSYPGWAIDDVVVQTGGGAATATPTPVAASPTATPTATSPSTCTSSQLLGNPGFETGSAAPWSATSGVINTSSSEPPHTGNWDAWLDGYGTTHTDTLAQSITLPAGCSSYQFSFWLHIDTAETSTTTAYDTLTVQVLSSYGNVLATLATYSNLDHNTGYTQKSFSLAAYAGQTITLKFTGTEDYSYQTSFVLDDTAVNVQ